MENEKSRVAGTTANIPNEPSGNNGNWFMKWVKNHMLITFLILIIIAGGLYLVIRMNINEKRASNERLELITQYETRIDSLWITGMQRTVQVFTWAIRSEMTRENMEQVNQFFTNFIHEPGVIRILLISPTNGNVILSTDRKDEGTRITDQDILQAERIFSVHSETVTRIVTPVMGLDTRLGILIVEVTP